MGGKASKTSAYAKKTEVQPAGAGFGWNPNGKRRTVTGIWVVLGTENGWATATFANKKLPYGLESGNSARCAGQRAAMHAWWKHACILGMLAWCMHVCRWRPEKKVATRNHLSLRGVQ